MKRVIVGGFQHETNTFSNKPGDWQLFVDRDGYPGLTSGEDLFEALRGYNLGISGILEGAQSVADWKLVPITWAYGGASGRVTKEAFEKVSSLLIDDIRNAGKIDALLLDMHGAMVSDSFEDGDAEFLGRVKSEVGSKTPIVAPLDLHANISQELFDLADMLLVYRTYPHIDMAETGAQAAFHLKKMLDYGKPFAKAFRQLPYLIPNTLACTLYGPTKAIFDKLTQLEQREGIVHMSFACGYNSSDAPKTGASFLAYGLDMGAVTSAIDELYDFALSQEDNYELNLWDVDEAVRYAIKNCAGRNGPVILADVQDNHGGGTLSDTNWILDSLVRHYAGNTLVGLYWDSETATAAHKSGLGSILDIELGGKTGYQGDKPYRAKFKVEALSSGVFDTTGSFYAGAPMDLGLTALLTIGGIKIVVTSYGEQAADPAMFTHLGADPISADILVLKSSVHYRAAFQQHAQEILEVEAPAPNSADNNKVLYTNLRNGLRIMPNGLAFCRTSEPKISH